MSIKLVDSLSPMGSFPVAEAKDIVQRAEIFEDAYVCHVTEGPHGRGIYDMPDFQFIREGSAASIKRRGDINFTMACISEAINWMRRENSGFGYTNWLY